MGILEKIRITRKLLTTLHFWDALMQILASQIARELEKAKHCAVYEPELTRVWPVNGKTREAKVAAFARKNGWRLRFYKDGFCAIFDKAQSG
jgi:hypothetical protein